MSMDAGAVRAEQDFVRLCHDGLDVASFQPAMLRALRRLLPVDAAFFATADPLSLLFTGAFAEEPLGESTGRFLDNEFGGADVNQFAQLAMAADHVASLDVATSRQRSSSARSREIMGPLGLGDELRAALVTDSRCWGYLCLHRADSSLGFSRPEAALIGRIGPHIAAALRQGSLLDGSSGGHAAAAPGVVILSDDFSLVGMTDEARQLLSLIDDTSGRLELPLAVYSVAAAVMSIGLGTVGPSVLPSVRVRLLDGRWLGLHASRVRAQSEDRHITVVVEPVQPRAVAPLLLAAHGLTAREAQVATLVLRGVATTGIVEALHISRHTVQDHLKSVFDKIGVRSRPDMVGLLLGAGGPPS